MIDFNVLLAIHLAAGGQIHRFGKRTPSALDCAHLGHATGESGRVLNCGCGAMTTLYQCELFKKICAPIPKTARAKMERGDVLLCRDCEHNPANQPASTPTTTAPE